MNRRDFLCGSVAAAALFAAPAVLAREDDNDRLERLLRTQGFVRDDSFVLTRPVLIGPGNSRIDGCKFDLHGNARLVLSGNLDMSCSRFIGHRNTGAFLEFVR